MSKQAILPSLCASVLLLCPPWASAAEPAAKPDPKAAAKPAVTNAPVSVFKDKKLEDAVRRQVFAKRESKEPLTAADVANVSTVSAPFAGITSLSGLEHCVALASLEIPGNKVADLAPLAGLKQLQYVHLASNQVVNIAPLASVPALQYIELSHNRLKDVKPLGGLTNLASIYLSANRLASIAPLTNLPRVATLYVDHNRIRSIEGLGSFRNLMMLSAAHNGIADLSPLAGLRAPSYLELSHNKVRDLAPLQRWMAADLGKTRNFAPFVRIYLEGNPLSKASKSIVDDLKAKGARINPPAR
jgi:Leucine-rich repeat (LRR) protein